MKKHPALTRANSFARRAESMVINPLINLAVKSIKVMLPLNLTRQLPCFPVACHSEPSEESLQLTIFRTLKILRCLEMRCHSERSEESRPGLSGAVCPAQSKIPGSARNDISWFPGAGQPAGMSDCQENDSPPQREEGQGWWVVSSANDNPPSPSLLRRGIIFIAGGEPKDHAVFTQNDCLGRTLFF